jgi:cob(I)alamin adenosyltransferase
VQDELALTCEALVGREGEKSAESCRQAALRLERGIDDLCADLPELRQFIRPGGCELAARLHLTRAICRRAERCVLAAGEETHAASGPAVIQYLNRLADALFALARLANHQAGLEDQPSQTRA